MKIADLCALLVVLAVLAALGYYVACMGGSLPACDDAPPDGRMSLEEKGIDGDS